MFDKIYTQGYDAEFNKEQEKIKMRDFVFDTELDNFFKTFDWQFANGNWGETKVEQKKNGTVESKDGKSTITLDVPGFKREEIKINIQDKKLVLS